MKKWKLGFTLLEVILVMAISTLLFMGVTIGITRRVATGRYDTATKELADFLKDVYSATLNTENARTADDMSRDYCTLAGSIATSDYANGRPVMAGNGIFNNSSDDNSTAPGRTKCAIYGKIIFFGTTDSKIYAFDVIGDVVEQQENLKAVQDAQQSGGVLGALQAVHADYLAAEKISSSDCRVRPAASYRTYESGWGTILKTANYGSSTGLDRDDDFIGMVMIVRAPATGEVATFFYEKIVNAPYNLDRFTDNVSSSPISIACSGSRETSISDYTLNYEDFEYYEENYIDSRNLGFCVGSDDFYVALSNLRRYIGFSKNGQNPSAITLDSSEENPCRA